MAKKRIWKPLTAEHREELVTLLVQAYHLANRTPSMRRLAVYLIKLAGWRWTADAVDSATGIVVPDAIKYDLMLRKKKWQFTLDTENIRL